MKSQEPLRFLSVVVFIGKGVLFSISHGRLRKANKQAGDAPGGRALFTVGWLEWAWRAS